MSLALLGRHHNDFEVWRYLRPKSRRYEELAEPLAMYLAASAILVDPACQGKVKQHDD